LRLEAVFCHVDVIIQNLARCISLLAPLGFDHDFVVINQPFWKFLLLITIQLW
jgi:hypothetical protein